MLSERAVSLTVGLGVNIPVARYLGPENFGALTYALAISALLAPLANLGLENIVAKELVHRPQDEARILGTVSALRKGVAAGVALLFSGWALFIHRDSDLLSVMLPIVVCAALLGNFGFLQHWFLVRGHRAAYAAAAIATTLMFAVVKIALIFAQAAVWVFLAVSAAELFLTGMAILIAYRVSSKGVVKWVWDFEVARRLLKKSWPLAISAVAAAIYLKIDLVMLANLSGLEAAGIYSAAARLSEIWYFLPGLLATALFPSMLRIKRDDEVGFDRRVQDMLDLYAGGACIIALATTLLAPVIVPLLYGAKYQGAVLILQIHVWAGVFIAMRAILSKWLIVEDLYIFSLVTHGSGAAVNVLLNLVLIPKWGGLGAAVSTLLSYSTASYLALLFDRRTRPMFRRMSLALIWPRRLPTLVSLATTYRTR